MPRNRRPPPPIDVVKRYLNYDRVTGFFRWLERPSLNVKVGGVAGSVDDRGYIRISLRGISYKAHRLAYYYVTGKWPDEVDHEDLDKANNAFDNLREASPVQNCANRPTRRDNVCGVKGVQFRYGKYIVRLGRSGHIKAGIFNTLDEAKEAYRLKSIELYGDFARASQIMADSQREAA